VAVFSVWFAPRSYKEENLGQGVQLSLQGMMRRDGAIVELTVDKDSIRAAVTRGSESVKLKKLHS
jgi:hypothetical protein